jgi:hypothetical protein
MPRFVPLGYDLHCLLANRSFPANTQIDDLQNLVAQQAEGDAEAKKESLAAQVEAGVPVNDLSNLIVKKKRRPEDATEAGAAEGDAKRPKTDGPSA